MVGVIVFIQLYGGMDQCFGYSQSGVWILFGKFCVDVEYFFWVVFLQFVVGDDRNVDVFENCLLVLWFVYVVIIDGFCFEGCWYLWWRCYVEENIGVNLIGYIVRVVEVWV